MKSITKNNYAEKIRLAKRKNKLIILGRLLITKSLICQIEILDSNLMDLIATYK